MKTSFILAATALSAFMVVGLSLIWTSLLPQPTYAANRDGDKIGLSSDNNSNNQNWLLGILVAIIGAVAASWNFITARWNGRWFQKLILEELGEISPNDPNRPTDGKLESDMKKEFIHKNILAKETENKDLILATNHKLIAHTKQLWSAFCRNDIKNFLEQLKYISEEPGNLFKPKKYDGKGQIANVYQKWLKWEGHLPEANKVETTDSAKT